MCWWQGVLYSRTHVRMGEMLACVGCRGVGEVVYTCSSPLFPGSFSLHTVQLGEEANLTLFVSSPSPLFSFFSNAHTTQTRDLEAELSSETLQPPTSPQPPASPHSEMGERESTPISVVDSSASKQHSPTPNTMVRVCLSVCAL